DTVFSAEGKGSPAGGRRAPLTRPALRVTTEGVRYRNRPRGRPPPMSADPRLSTLLDRWQQSQDRGCPLSAEELCRDCPELLPEVQRRIAILKGMARLANGAGETLAGKPNEEGQAPATAPSRPGDDPSPLTLPLAEEAARAPAVPGFEIEG